MYNYAPQRFPDADQKATYEQMMATDHKGKFMQLEDVQPFREKILKAYQKI